MCEGRTSNSIVFFETASNTIGEFDLTQMKLTWQSSTLFQNATVHTIVKLDKSDFALGSSNGLHISNMETETSKLHLFENHSINAMVYTQNG